MVEKMIPPRTQENSKCISDSRSQQKNHNVEMCVAKRERTIQNTSQVMKTSCYCWRLALSLIIISLATQEYFYLTTNNDFRNRHHHQDQTLGRQSEGATRTRSFVLLASAHIVLTKDDNSQSLVLTGENGKGGKGKGKGKGGGDRLVIAGMNMGSNGQNSNMVMQDAANREGDVVINGNSMIIPSEDGHIILADGRSDSQGGGGGRMPMPPPNFLAFWLPYINGRSGRYRMMMPFYGGGQFG